MRVCLNSLRKNSEIRGWALEGARLHSLLKNSEISAWQPLNGRGFSRASRRFKWFTARLESRALSKLLRQEFFRNLFSHTASR